MTLGLKLSCIHFAEERSTVGLQPEFIWTPRAKSLAPCPTMATTDFRVRYSDWKLIPTASGPKPYFTRLGSVATEIFRGVIWFPTQPVVFMAQPTSGETPEMA